MKMPLGVLKITRWATGRSSVGSETNASKKTLDCEPGVALAESASSQRLLPPPTSPTSPLGNGNTCDHDVTANHFTSM